MCKKLLGCLLLCLIVLITVDGIARWVIGVWSFSWCKILWRILLVLTWVLKDFWTYLDVCHDEVPQETENKRNHSKNWKKFTGNIWYLHFHSLFTTQIIKIVEFKSPYSPHNILIKRNTIRRNGCSKRCWWWGALLEFLREQCKYIQSFMVNCRQFSQPQSLMISHRAFPTTFFYGWTKKLYSLTTYFCLQNNEVWRSTI